MLKKISSLKLLGILGVLILVYLASNYFSKGNRSESLRSELVAIDTAKVTKILISGPQEHLELVRTNSEWTLNLPNDKQVTALPNKVKTTLSSLLSIKPGRMATKDRAKWKDYQVDSTGTRVQIFEGEQNTLDLVVGRFGMAGQRQFYSFVRLFEDNEVYTADNFMGLSGGNQSSSYRDQIVLKLETDSVTSINFTYPSDSSFQLINYDSLWLVDQKQPADSAGLASYFVGLRNVTSDKFNDEVDPTRMDKAIFELNFDSKTEGSITIQAYLMPEQDQLVYHSSLNPDAYFQDTTLVGKLFKGMGHFVTKE